MTAPMQFTLTQRANEPVSVTVPFPWLANQWPLPLGSRIKSSLRAAAGDVNVVMSFSTRDGSLITSFDAANTQMRLTYRDIHLRRLAYQPSLVRADPYFGDVVLWRPQVAADPRIDVIGQFTLLMLPGFTYGY